ncbi:hypothetical protein P170DRAFT_504826 [Aspergillus steynii IBT 23096]|uniref:Rhodopsin domain-containing protein n=1 Tax=Aspergillus steynii IBT 23096 TaxID=1392250 RepID=A0A2I2GM43_9EURO|nr:uncharacterized protein P170DRAFT_504826 [Aspergillus steynii IBT 23096]PLB53961.1 hypothetical protein P170DRAFT_504826 [Aspergillus steynii IBT 23096]
MILILRFYPMGLNQIGYTTVVVTILFLTLSVIAIGLRVKARHLKRASLGPDDWFSLASTGFFFAFCANIMVCVFTRGSGQVYQDPAESERQKVMYLKALYAITPLYVVDVTLVKLSILFLYRRIFSNCESRRTNSFVIAICLFWFSIAVISGLLYCRPIRQQWDPHAGGDCFDFSLYFLIMTLADLVIDIVILSFPIPPIIRLRLPLRKRVAVAGIFLLGAFVLVTGAVRISYVYRHGERHVAHADAILWSVINLGIAIICACLPTYPPLLSLFRRQRQGSSKHGAQSPRGINSSSANRTYNHVQGESKDSDPYWWGYIDDGQGWTARRKSEYMKTPEYNKELRRQLRRERKANKGRVPVPQAAYGQGGYGQRPY